MSHLVVCLLISVFIYGRIILYDVMHGVSPPELSSILVLHALHVTKLNWDLSMLYGLCFMIYVYFMKYDICM